MHSVPDDDRLAERQPRLGAVPIDKLVDGVAISPLGVWAENCGFGNFKVRQPQDRFIGASLDSLVVLLLHYSWPPSPRVDHAAPWDQAQSGLRVIRPKQHDERSQADLWGVIHSLHMNDMPTFRPGDIDRQCSQAFHACVDICNNGLRPAMTIQIPDDLASGLERVATLQHKSIDQLAVDSLRQLLEQEGSPGAILRAIRGLPHPSAAAVDDLEAAILSARLPVHDQGTFDEFRQG
jgi:hypothetical protein